MLSLKSINDLVVSPVNPYILASASDDSTVRIWSLHPDHISQPCAAILEGEGHKETVLTLVGPQDQIYHMRLTENYSHFTKQVDIFSPVA